MKYVRIIFHILVVMVGAVGLTLAFFLVLPLMQTISKPPQRDMVVHTVDTANVPPPPPPPEEEPEDEEQEEKPPELQKQNKPLDLSQLELALDPGFSDGMMSGDFTVDLNTGGSGEEDVNALFSMSELDKRPRVIYQPSPRMSQAVRRKAPGTVYIIFIVNKDGRVENPRVQKSTHPIFEKPALAAVKQWRFEPGQRKGESVRFRMRVPITFPKR